MSYAESIRQTNDGEAIGNTGTFGEEQAYMPKAVWSDTVRSYLQQQILSAANREERAAAIRLAEALAAV